MWNGHGLGHHVKGGKDIAGVAKAVVCKAVAVVRVGMGVVIAVDVDVFAGRDVGVVVGRTRVRRTPCAAGCEPAGRSTVAGDILERALGAEALARFARRDAVALEVSMN